MSKLVKIPTDGMNPFVIFHNGKKFVFKPGETRQLSDGLALEIEEYIRWRDKYKQSGYCGASAQSDLSQNDPTAPDYVKNREVMVSNLAQNDPTALDYVKGRENIVSNWGQTDENALDYVKGRTHGEFEKVVEKASVAIVNAKDNFGNKVANVVKLGYQIKKTNLKIPDGMRLYVSLDGQRFEVTTLPAQLGKSVEVVRFDDGYSLMFKFDTYTPDGGIDRQNCYMTAYTVESKANQDYYYKDKMLGIELVEPETKTLDLKYLPESHQFGEERTAILPETAVTFSSGSWSAEGAYALVEGKTYSVKWDGTEYICVAYVSPYAAAGVVSIGNKVDIGENTGEPFSISSVGGTSLQIVRKDGKTSGTVTVSIDELEIKKLDKKFLPDDVGGQKMVYTYEYGSGTLYKDPELNEAYMKDELLELGLNFVIRITEGDPNAPLDIITPVRIRDDGDRAEVTVCTSNGANMYYHSGESVGPM